MEGEKGKGGTEEESHFLAKVEISTGHAVKKLAGRVLAQERLNRPPPFLSQTRQKSINLCERMTTYIEFLQLF